MTAAANIAALDSTEGKARENGDAVIALLPCDRHMIEAERADRQIGEQPVHAFDFLKAKDVRPLRAHETLDQVEPQPDRVDVPCREAKTHEVCPKKKGAQPLRVVGRQKRVFCARVPGGKPARADHIFG